LIKLLLPSGKTISSIIVSTAFGVDGRGIFPHTLKPRYRNLLAAAKETGTTVITKSVTRHGRKGNFIPRNPFTWKYIRKLPSRGRTSCAMLNAYGLTNPGVEEFINRLKKADKSRLIPSIYPEFSKGEDLANYEARVAAAMIYEQAGVSEIELNFSCPNSKELKKFYPKMYIIAKISIVHPYEFAQELERTGVDMIHSVNTVPFELVYPGKTSPLAKVGGGGVSGTPIFWQAYDYNKGLRQKVKVPIIMGGGVTNSDFAIKYIGIGADTVSICTSALRKPREAEKIIRLLNAEF